MKRLLVVLFMVLLSVCSYGINRGECKKLNKAVVKGAMLSEIDGVSDSLDVNFTVELMRGAVRSQYKMIFQPYVKEGADSLKLEGIVVYGNTRTKREEQERVLQGKRYVPDTNNYERFDNSVVTIDYHRRIYNMGWITSDSSRLVVRQMLEGCCSSDKVGEDSCLFRYVRLPEVFEPVYSRLKKKDNWTFSKDDLTMYYKVSRIEINDTLFSNKQILAEIIDAVNTIRGDRYRRLDKIEITGHASPEGPLKFNQYLGQNRAIALRDYVKSHVDWLTDDDFKINNGVENWEGMYRMVSMSDMKYRDEVLQMIDSIKPEDGLKRILMRFEGGEPWDYCLKNFFPKLRTARFVSVGYDMIDDEVFDVGNMVVDMIEESDYSEALLVLKPFENSGDGRLYNLFGVCLMMTGDKKGAVEWFEKGVIYGDKDAAENLKRVESMSQE